ncbi:hypothetical protein NBRGN_042_00180 [Nocardia brasiliensis NBRC 14402]|uniref:hypothetical protein n=1 Tax=Nocardia brasiliensis TaxID=37326 RepID=UPI0002EB8D28|nr:hypothetical protein [Nocardia brasiliensis]ASF11912.1 hypothetical protein CEQ30_36355 [Nocardia brasiliensis]GAJ81686.1 hypothetical protein NBRGN_042_00180 [Nocardia brasiliensis NBRC 14402]SUB09231.1 Uncharacterised protein [Nocardia brasiliensis]
MPSNENANGVARPELSGYTAPGITAAALHRAVDEGELWIDGVLVAEGVHERCARRYEQLANQIEDQMRVLSAASSLPGFGGFASGDALRGGFENKAHGALTRMWEYAEAARELALTFRAAATKYQGADHALAVAVDRIDAGAAHA